MNKNNLPEATDQDIIDLVMQMCADGLMFTRFDMTKKLRHNGFHALHKDVKHVMERIVFPSIYDNTLTTVGGKRVFLFHPNTADINEYDSNAVARFKVDRDSTTSDDSGDSGDSEDANGSSHVHNYSFDRHGHRYSVKATISRKAGFPAGASVHVNIENGKIILNKKDGRKIKVDCYSNIRIPQSDFKKAFGTLPDEIDVDIQTDQIEIKES